MTKARQGISRPGAALVTVVVVVTASLGVLTGGVAAAPVSQTFAFTGGPQTFVVPAGVTSITVDAYGAAGGGNGGLGGHATATIPVTPGETLQVNVGGEGGAPQTRDPIANPSAPFVAAPGGFNGGGPSPSGTFGSAGGGGGASDVRRGGSSLANRVVVAGGGGGGGARGGGGGGETGENGGTATPNPTIGSLPGHGGGGGTQTQGGMGGAAGSPVGLSSPGTSGSLGLGGSGGSSLGFTSFGGSGGGGGGGYFGGGGGGAGVNGGVGGGGGGGSGFGPPGVVFETGVRSGNGLVTITYELPVADSTPPTCFVTALIQGPPRQMQVTVQDTGSGLQAITNVQIRNGTVSFSFTPGTTSPVVVTATKTDQRLSTVWSFDAVDVAGNVRHCA